MFTPSALSAVAGETDIATATMQKDGAGIVYNFYTTAKAGTADLGITSSQLEQDGGPATGFAENMAVVADTDLGTLTLAITNAGATGPDSKFQIKVPSGFPAPIEAPFLVGGGRKTDQDGHTVNGTPNSGARTISGDIRNNVTDDQTPPNGTINVNLETITYHAGKMATQGRHVFGLSTSAGPHAGLVERTGGEGADLHPRYIDVTAKHDAGELKVYRADGTEFTESAPEQVHDLVLVYKAGGYMPSGSVTFWRPILTSSNNRCFDGGRWNRAVIPQRQR